MGCNACAWGSQCLWWCMRKSACEDVLKKTCIGKGYARICNGK